MTNIRKYYNSAILYRNTRIFLIVYLLDSKTIEPSINRCESAMFQQHIQSNFVSNLRKQVSNRNNERRLERTSHYRAKNCAFEEVQNYIHQCNLSKYFETQSDITHFFYSIIYVHLRAKTDQRFDYNCGGEHPKGYSDRFQCDIYSIPVPHTGFTRFYLVTPCVHCELDY